MSTKPRTKNQSAKKPSQATFRLILICFYKSMSIVSFLPPYEQIIWNVMISNNLDYLTWFSYKRTQRGLANAFLIHPYWDQSFNFCHKDLLKSQSNCGLKLLSSLIFLCVHKSDICYLENVETEANYKVTYIYVYQLEITVLGTQAYFPIYKMCKCNFQIHKSNTVAIPPLYYQILFDYRKIKCMCYNLSKNLGNFHNSKYGENIFVCKFICIWFSFRKTNS